MHQPHRPTQTTLPDIDGFYYYPDLISNKEEKHLIDVIDHQPWSNQLQRRVQHYGYRYDYRKRTIDESMHLGFLPEWSHFIIERCLYKGSVDTSPDQLIINEYSPGQGIAPHIDRATCFKEPIFALSLGSFCVFRLTHPKTNVQKELIIQPRSLYVLAGPARYEWKHQIPARKNDPINGKWSPRGRRLSMTFRSVKL